MITLEEVMKHEGVQACIKKSEKYLDLIGYTDHGMVHLKVTLERASRIAKNVGLSEREQELAAIAAYCHDMGNFLQRSGHCYTGAMIFSNFFMGKCKTEEDFNEVTEIMQAIANHDEHVPDIVNKIGAVLVIADKSDVHRRRVKNLSPENIKADIHDRVNYSVINSDLSFNNEKKEIALNLKIDTEVTGPMEYFEIFNKRMVFSRKAAEFLGYSYILSINDFKLS